jgi:hypothetical protein
MAVVDSALSGAATQTACLAVDVGVSTVKMAWLDNDRIVDSSQRHNDFPAVVAFKGGDLLVGKDALSLSAAQPAAVLLHVREWLGLVSSVRLAGNEISIVDAMKALYQAAARSALRTTDNVASVIVHPARWPERRVAMMARAAGAAGLDVVEVVPDAVAVAAAGPTGGDVLVVDVGSFLTVSVVDACEESPRILWSQSSLGAGGEAIAHAIRAVTDVPVIRARALARGADNTSVDWTAVGQRADRGVAAAIRMIDEVLLRSRRDSGEIARVYLAGGASVAPFVRDALRRRFSADRVDKVFELSGPSASAAYGALRLSRPDRAAIWHNEWPPTAGEPPGRRVEQPVETPPETEVVTLNTGTGSSPVADPTNGATDWPPPGPVDGGNAGPAPPGTPGTGNVPTAAAATPASTPTWPGGIPDPPRGERVFNTWWGKPSTPSPDAPSAPPPEGTPLRRRRRRMRPVVAILLLIAVVVIVLALA